MTRPVLVVVSSILLALSGCYSSEPLAPEAREVVAEVTPAAAWRPAGPDDLPGLWASTSIQGASAGAVLKAYYAFDATGGYSGAALVLSEGRPRFVLLAEDGTWTLEESALDLHDGSAPMTASVANAHLRLSAGDDVLELERVPLE